MRCVVAIGWGLSTLLAGSAARADETEPEQRPSPTVAIATTAPAEGRGLAVRRPGTGQGGGGGAGGSSWWLATGGIGVALVALGTASLGAGRWARLPGREPGAVRVVGRVQLTSRHAVHLLRAGDRTLIVGTGHGGPPALLGELADPSPAVGSVHGPISTPDRPGGAA